MCIEYFDMDEPTRNHIDNMVKKLGGKVDQGHVMSYALGKVLKGLVPGYERYAMDGGSIIDAMKAGLSSMDSHGNTPSEFADWLKNNFGITAQQAVTDVLEGARKWDADADIADERFVV